ncbi:hypothetical protein G6045_22670 [Streptomyces sp. YC504]|uniref:Uncharacterized protein n=1 Tax=Streptomyces mesophilus TaxID=1775132 RepID=A0A6G4XMI6_9ACTN|nr:hypothetical protein [Streptomyces mesophilus]NGO78443.1 hypothetical protein [Streptomyces mesophilus]
METPVGPRVLVVGFDPYRIGGSWDPAPLAAAIDEGLAEFAAHGVGVETCLIGLDGRDDVAAVVTKALQPHAWDCVVVGGGLRQSDDQLALFEQVINLIHRHVPTAAIAFNRSPSTMYEAAARWVD